MSSLQDEGGSGAETSDEREAGQTTVLGRGDAASALRGAHHTHQLEEHVEDDETQLIQRHLL